MVRIAISLEAFDAKAATMWFVGSIAFGPEVALFRVSSWSVIADTSRRLRFKPQRGLRLFR
jgi:hypothetical protein